ncbi:MAG: hypothetical protein AB7I30_08400 [Isosphaeraceae bacterium]
MTLPRFLRWTLALALLGLATARGEALANNPHSNNYYLTGTVYFTNLQNATQQGALVPYSGYGWSALTGPNRQTGSIRNLSGLIPINVNTYIFYGEVGPHPWMPSHHRVHLIETWHGNIFCAWRAVFTLQILNPQGDAIFSGDGHFHVVGGTDRYRRASGQFRTQFRSGPVPAGANDASADVIQYGTIKR